MITKFLIIKLEIILLEAVSSVAKYAFNRDRISLNEAFSWKKKETLYAKYIARDGKTRSKLQRARIRMF